ncbi:MAG: CDP-diacylglycerol--glycerol-3-phosphate 3-phosphatidyltransferase [Verrucomicrobiota bacterium]|jgi:CDP-diacylglycerol--glycerol-3-phosphate 3-phosphatidyltransferase
MNLPNQLTLARLGITAVFVLVLESPWPLARTCALLLFALASLTDYADGYLARRYHLITDFGKLMDPLADKILLAAALIGLASVNAIPAWAATCIVAREFLITGLRQLAAAKGTVLPAERVGKHKTIWQIITILFFLLAQTLEEWTQQGWIAPMQWIAPWKTGIGTALIGLTLVLTLGSGLGYLWKNRALIADR